jgi:hypothetical protein
MNTENIIKQINKLTEKTKERKLDWKVVNENFFRWVQQSGLKVFNTSLQRQILVSGNPPTKDLHYFLTIQTTDPNEVLLRATSIDDIAFKEPLKNLYDAVLKISEDMKMERLDELIEGIE